jgi:hypothetical protein
MDSSHHYLHSPTVLMKELLRSNDLAYLSYVTYLLSGEGVEHVLLDGYTSAVEGSIGAIPRRLMVDEDDIAKARRILSNASLTIPDQ